MGDPPKRLAGITARRGDVDQSGPETRLHRNRNSRSRLTNIFRGPSGKRKRACGGSSGIYSKIIVAIRTTAAEREIGIYFLAAPFCLALAMARPARDLDDSASYEDRRAYARVAIAMPAFLHANGERHAVHLLDLSAGGAKLNSSVSLPTGTAVVLDCGSLGRSAVVRWHTGGLLGICFDSELDAREVTALIARSVALDNLMKTRR